MICYSIVRVKDERVAAVLVGKSELAEPRASRLIEQFENLLSLPIMLLTRDEATWVGARTRAHFETSPFLYQLISNGEVDWRELPAVEAH